MKAFEFCTVSPPGAAALGAVALEGPGCASVIDQLFRPRSPRWTLAQSGYGELVIGGSVLDDVVVVPVDRDVVVITLHGNPTLLGALEAHLKSLGGNRAARPAEFAAGFLAAAQPVRSVRVEALSALSTVHSLAVAAWLLEQSDVEGDGLAGWIRRCSPRASREDVEEIASRRWGIGLLQPPTVVLSGPPNAGKSTLFNRWVGRRRVVEHEAPGTTRDLIIETVELRGFPIRLVDGAGLRPSTEAVEREGVRRMVQICREADLVLDLVPPEADPQSSIPDRDDLETRALKIRSRFDQIAPGTVDEALIGVSGRTGVGIDRLERTILATLYGVDEILADPTPFTRRQIDLLRLAAGKLEEGEEVHAIWAQF